VNDAMTDGLNVREPVQRGRGTRLQIVEDAPGGIGVLLQLQLLAVFLIAGAAINELCRFRRPVDAALGQQNLPFRLEEAEFKATGAGVTNQNFHSCLEHLQSLAASPWVTCRHADCHPTAG
jgi:hypothetical protein